jgi:endonuclease III
MNKNKKAELFRQVIDYFLVNMPVAKTELIFRNPFHLIVATILSAQCTDKRVNMITPALLLRFPDPATMAAASPEEVFPYISSCSYPNNKARHLVNMAGKLMELFDGQVPSDVEELQQLPGVGRKTANVVASVCFDKPVMAVDTHVFRVAARIGLSVNAKTPIETERQLVEYIPPELISKAHHWLILHGRYVCRARKPECEKCGLTAVCAYYKRSGKEQQA